MGHAQPGHVDSHFVANSESSNLQLTVSGNRTPFQVLMGMLAHHKGALILALFLSVVSAGLSLVQPTLINNIISAVGNQPLAPMVWGLLGILVVSLVVSMAQAFVMAKTAESAVFSTRKQLIARMLRLPIQSYDRHRSGDLVTRLGSDTNLIRSAFVGGLVDALGGVVMMVGAIVLMALIDLVMLGLVLAVVLFTMVVIVLVSRLIQRYTTRAQAAIGAMGADMSRALGAIRTIRASGAAPQVEEQLQEDARESYQMGINIAKVGAIMQPATGLALQGSFLLVLGIGGARVASGTISIGDLISFVLYLFILAMPLAQISDAITSMRQAMGAIERISEIMDIDPESTGGATAEPARDITFENVSFSYNEEQPVLKNVSFHIPAGKKTAFVGPSGSGKSTTLALIERFYDVDSGRILLGDQDTAGLSRSSVRNVIGYVEQEAAVLSGTVRENLQLGVGNVDDERCWWALDQVNLRQRMEEQEGLDTVLGERGLSLSGGQRQRLALARMLLMDTPVLLLDEPTSAVDSQNEQVILDSIQAISEDRTLVVVAHRLSTVTDSDQIIVIDEGRAVAAGTHQELLESSPIYRDLASRQLLDG